MDKRLLEFASTDAQREAIEATLRLGTMKKAARELNIAASSLQTRIERVRRAAAARGYDPDHDMTHPCGEGFLVKGVSTLFNEGGGVVSQWVKTTVDQERQAAAMKLVVDELKLGVKRLAPRTKLGIAVNDLLNLYVISDAHIGMLSHHEETGHNWDTKIAEHEFDVAIASLVDNSPKAGTGFLVQLGDGLHSDGIAAVTPRSGHLLDQDGRFHKVVRAATRVFRRAIEKLLDKHQQVKVLMMQGNHDPASSIWLQELFHALYENEPRVDVIVSPSPFYAESHGRAFLGFHHGHGCKPVSVADVFIANYREMYGASTQAYIHTGHRHSRQWLRDSGHCIIEQHATIIPPDAYAAGGGYTPERSMNCITYSAEAGREKHRCTYHPSIGAAS